MAAFRQALLLSPEAIRVCNRLDRGAPRCSLPCEETNAGHGLAGPVFMFVIWGLHGEAGCHGGVATGFFVDTSGQSPTCADKRTERVGLGRSRTRPNPTAQLSLGGRLRTCPRSFSPACFTYEASWFGVSGCPGVSSEAGRSSGHRRKREKGRGRNASAFFLGLTGDAGPATRSTALLAERISSLSLRGNSCFEARFLPREGSGFFFSRSRKERRVPAA